MYGFHPAILAFRFVLELAALVAMGIGAASYGTGAGAWLLGIGVPMVAAAGWGIFNVPGDRSRSGEAPVAVRGALRLVLELGFFAAAVLLVRSVSRPAAAVLAAAVLIHYLLSRDRIRWLLAN